MMQKRQKKTKRQIIREKKQHQNVIITLEESCGTLDTGKLEAAHQCPARAFLTEI